MTLRDNLAAVMERIREAIDAIDAADAQPEPEASPAEETAPAEAEVIDFESPSEVVPADEPVRDGGPASV